MKRLIQLIVLLQCVLWPMLSWSQDYPNKPIRLVVPSPNGGGYSVMARAFAERMSEYLGQPVQVENLAGRFGAAGAEMVAKSTPDGYTLLFGSTSSLIIAPAGAANASYDPATSFTAVGLIGELPFILLVSPKLEVKSVAELIALARNKPGALKFGSWGEATLSHLIAEYFNKTMNIDLKPEIIRNPMRIYPALADGSVDIYFDSTVLGATAIGNGSAKGVAVLGYKGSSVLSQLPVIQAQYPEVRGTQWLGIVGPSGLPRPIVEKLHAAMVKALNTTEVKEKLAALGAETVESTPDSFQKYLSLDPAKWREVIQSKGIKLPQ